MAHANLVTRDGAAVQRVEIPPFQAPPEVIVWGLRHFARDYHVLGSLTYRECFAYHVPPPTVQAGG